MQAIVTHRYSTGYICKTKKYIQLGKSGNLLAVGFYSENWMTFCLHLSQIKMISFCLTVINALPYIKSYAKLKTIKTMTVNCILLI